MESEFWGERKPKAGLIYPPHLRSILQVTGRPQEELEPQEHPPKWKKVITYGAPTPGGGPGMTSPVHP